MALVAGNVAVLALLLAVGFAGLEAWYRFVYDETDTANKSRLSKRWFERYWHENADGIRDDVDYPRPLVAGRRRITFLGDSYTAGHGLQRVEDRFAHRIRRARPEWEVHTLAYNGINTVEQVDLLRRFAGEGYGLDVVVLVFVYNDIDSFIQEFQDFYHYVDIPPDFLAPLLDHSYAADLYYQRWRQRDMALRSDVPYPVLRSEAYEGRPWESMEYTLDQLAREVDLGGGRLAAVTFPWMQMLAAGENALPMYAKLEGFWRSRGVPHLQLLDVLAPHADEDLLVNRRDTHPNARAHEIAAEAMLVFLESEVLTR
ncbi:MAG: GDSL-type esterase/lipase family protein [Myxococcota bacterium]